MSMNITVVKDHRRYEFIDPHRYKTTMTITISRSNNNEESVFFVPVDDIKADIEVRDSNGRKMICLSTYDLQNKFEIVPEDIRPVCDYMDKSDYGWVPVLLTPHNSEYEIIEVTFESPMDPTKYKTKWLEKHFKFKSQMYRLGFSIGSKYAIKTKEPYYIDVAIKTSKHYKIDYKDTDNQCIKSSTIVPNLVTLRKHMSDPSDAMMITCNICVADVIAKSIMHTIIITGIIMTAMTLMTNLALQLPKIDLNTWGTISVTAMITLYIYIVRSKALTIPDDIMRFRWTVMIYLVVCMLLIPQIILYWALST